MLRQKMHRQHGRSTKCNLADERPMRCLSNPGEFAIRRIFHRDGLIEHLLADSSQAAESRQSLNQRYVQFLLLSARKSATDCRVVHLQGARGTGQGATARHCDEMTKIFPIGHLCDFSGFTGTYTELPHRSHCRNLETNYHCRIVSMSASHPVYPRITLIAASLGFVIVLLDVSVVNVALDALRMSFSTNVAGLEWVVNALHHSSSRRCC